MTLTHDFYLITKVNDPTSFVKLGINLHDFIIDKVQIIDPIILYIIDTLEWIPTKNPAKAGLPNGNGLYYHGVPYLIKRLQIN